MNTGGQNLSDVQKPLNRVLRTQNPSSEEESVLTFDAVQVGRGQGLSLALVSRNTLVLGLLGTRHVARAPALLQVVAAAGGGNPGQR